MVVTGCGMGVLGWRWCVLLLGDVGGWASEFGQLA